MLRYILRRLLAIIPLLVLVTGFIFVIGQYGTGDLAAYLTSQESGGRMDPALYQLNRERLHLNDPLFVRYGDWLVHAVQGDLGVSYIQPGQPSVSYLLGQALPITLQLALASLVIIVLVGIPLGILAAVFHNSMGDYVIVGSATLLSSIPIFVLGPLMLYFLVIQTHIVPVVGIGWHGLFSEESILPLIILSANSCLTTVRFTRASVLEVLSQEYVRSARAKGLSMWHVLFRHVLKNALLPVVTVVGLTATYLLSGSLFLEIIFNIQGFGLLTLNALQEGDVQTMTGIVLVTATLLMLVNLITDILYTFLDPRVKINA